MTKLVTHGGIAMSYKWQFKGIPSGSTRDIQDKIIMDV